MLQHNNNYYFIKYNVIFIYLFLDFTKLIIIKQIIFNISRFNITQIFVTSAHAL